MQRESAMPLFFDRERSHEGLCKLPHAAICRSVRTEMRKEFAEHESARLSSESRPLRQQKENFCLPKVLFLFIQAAGLAYHHDAVVYIISPFGAVSHHAPACILPAA